jgi:hypothetical protein
VHLDSLICVFKEYAHTLLSVFREYVNIHSYAAIGMMEKKIGERKLRKPMNEIHSLVCVIFFASTFFP